MNNQKMYDNQKMIVIGTKVMCDKHHPYSITNVESKKLAMNDLDGNCFKLWSYLQGNQEGFKFSLSQKELQEYGLKRGAYLRAVRILIEKGYLVPCEIKPGVPGYRFEEMLD